MNNIIIELINNCRKDSTYNLVIFFIKILELGQNKIFWVLFTKTAVNTDVTSEEND